MLGKPDLLLADLAPSCEIEKGIPCAHRALKHKVGQAGRDFVQRKEGPFPAGASSSLSGHTTE